MNDEPETLQQACERFVNACEKVVLEIKKVALNDINEIKKWWYE